MPRPSPILPSILAFGKFLDHIPGAESKLMYLPRLQKFAQTSALSFVPPDGNFVLMEYRVSPTALTATKTLATSNVTQNQLNYIPFILKPSIEIGEKGGK